MHSSPPPQRISAYCGTVRRLSHPVTAPSCPARLRSCRVQPRPLDPQDYGLGVSADQSGQSGGVVGAPTCSLSVRMHAVWSPDGPQDGTACMPYPAKLSRTVPDLARYLCHVRKGPPNSKPVGVGSGSQLAQPTTLDDRLPYAALLLRRQIVLRMMRQTLRDKMIVGTLET
jgi:hypothetical protein